MPCNISKERLRGGQHEIYIQGHGEQSIHGEDILHVTRCGVDFQLTGLQADLWLNGRFGFSEVKEGNILAEKSLNQLKRQELVELAGDDTAGEYRALTQCVITPASPKGAGRILSSDEKNLLKWLTEAGLRLSMAELVYLNEHNVRPEPQLLGAGNRPGTDGIDLYAGKHHG